MTERMRERWLAATLSLALLVGGAACSPRQVEVRTAPAASRASDVTLHFTNNLSQGVNVYVTTNGSDTFLRQVAANSVEHLPVVGVASGSTVTLKATTVDGTRTFSKGNVTLTGTYSWQVP